MKENLLPHYNALLNQKDTAYYLLCQQIPVEFSPNATMDNLWLLHTENSKIFKEFLSTYDSTEVSNHDGTIESSYLDLKIEISKKMLEQCEFCENKCKANRKQGDVGYCGIGEGSKVSSAFLHHGEEPPLVPSGTIFFSGCTFECVFCQNWDISTIGKRSPANSQYNNERRSNGTSVDGKQLAVFADVLARQGARNINYVGGDPTPNLHTIIDSLNYQTKNICQLWNSNFYNTIKALELLTDLMDFWLPDFKYGNNKCGKKYSNITNYWDVLTRNLKYIYDWGSRDIIIRHLVMPGHLDCCTKPILKWVAKEIPGTVVNIMQQYRPEHKVNSSTFPEVNRRVTRKEIIEAYSLAERLKIPYKFVS